MGNIRKEVAIYLQLVGFVAIWIGDLLASGVELRINWEALKKLPEVVTLYWVGHLIFTKWAWRLPIFQGWLVPFPDLQGTWAGTVRSTWEDPRTRCAAPPFPIILTIRQSFSSINCVMYSKDSTSFSSTAQIVGEEDGIPPRLSFNYSNRPRAAARDHSEMHEGAAILRIIRKPERALEGEYWTDRKTTGDIQVLFKGSQLADHFSM